MSALIEFEIADGQWRRTRITDDECDLIECFIDAADAGLDDDALEFACRSPSVALGHLRAVGVPIAQRRETCGETGEIRKRFWLCGEVRFPREGVE